MTGSGRGAVTVALVSDARLDVGGVETHLLSLLRRADPSCYAYRVVAPASPSFASRAEALGARVVHWQPAHVLDAGALVRLVRLLRANRVRLLHIHSPRAAILGRIAARLLALPVIVTVHLPSYHYPQGEGLGSRCKRRFYRWVEAGLNRTLTDRVIYVSSLLYEEALALGVAPPGRSMLIENGIDLGPYDQPGPVPAAARRPRVICWLGRMDWIKGVDLLLEAAALLARGGEVWELWLAGDGPARPALEAQARRLGLEGRVRFLGFCAGVPDLLRDTDLFVLPSRREAMPMAVLEAMAAGLPAVVTAVGENPRLVKDGVTGLVVPPEDPPALAAALARLLADPECCRRMGQAARRNAAGYSDVRMVRRTLEVYASLLDERQPR